MATAPLPTGPLVDGHQRVHRDLRLSVTDRCNFRCTYCMPAEGLPWQPREAVLTFEEMTRIARVFVERFGFTSIRLTGGEPTVRAELPTLVRALAALPIELSLTTNGSRLDRLAAPLADAGLSRINISLDSLRRDRFARTTRRDALPEVIAGIRAARRAGLSPVKINVVVTRGVNDDEILDFAEFGRREEVTVRFIEFMPLDADHQWRSGTVVPSAEIVATIATVHPLSDIARGSSPAQAYRYVDGAGEIGVIGSVTEPFCASCDRVRLTADGQLRACLFSTDETDLRAVLRAPGRSDHDIDADLAAAIARTVAAKGPGHGISDVHFIRPARTMSQIGG